MKLCTAACLWLVSASLYAQVAEELIIPETLTNQRSVCSAPMDAGTKIITRLSGDGIDVSNEDPIVLCFGEQIFINHNNDSDLSGDPDPSTDPGIGYAFYTGIPNATGPEINDLTLDPALLDIPPPPMGGVWVARGNSAGDATFVNTGNVQNTYFGGAAGRLWFAPITITDFNNLSFDDGSCLDVRTDEFFSVLYLNDIRLVDFSTPMSSLSGMMSLAGGISEVDGTPYSVTLVKFDDPTVTGIVDAAVAHNGTTTFSVPEAGNYTLTVTDGQGCSKTFIVTVPADDPVGLCHTTGDVPADGNICMPVIVGNVNDISGVSFTTTWDPTILDLTLISDIHPSLGSTASFNQDLAPQGKLTFLWFDLNADVISMNDGDTLFSLCFNGVGFPGETSVLGFSNDPAVISVSDLSDELPTQLKEGAVTITVPDAPRIYASACPDGMGNAQLAYVGYGGTDSYEFTLRNSAGVVISTDEKLAGEQVSFPSLVPDDYDIEILDQNGISDVLTITVSSTLFSVDTLVLDPTCPGSLDGKIVINGINGSTGPFTTAWMGDGNAFFNIDSLTDLGPGDWSLIVNDANGCADTLLVTLEEDSLSLSFAETPPICSGLTGSIEAAASSASGSDLTWTWTDENGVQIGNIVTSPSPVTLNSTGPGKYFLTVSNGSCSVTDSTELGVLKNLSLAVQASTSTTVTCNGDADGFVEVMASADINQSAFDFVWSTNTIDTGIVTLDVPNASTSASRLPPGTYSLTVTDQQGCMIDTSFIIGEPDSLRFNLGITPPDCPDGDNGRISAIFNVFGGTEYPPPRAPYDYHWYQLTDTSSISLGTRGSERTGLSAGRYALAVTDANGCQDSTTIELGSGPNIQIILDQDLVCPGDSVGQLSVEGDLAGNEISWSTGSDMETISNLTAGLYQVSVTEYPGTDSACASLDTFRLLDPDFGVVVLSPMQFAPRSVCNEPDSGIIFNLRTNYSGPLNFMWTSLNDSITTIPFLSVDSSGLYPFTAFDRITGCTVYDSVIDVQFPERIAIVLDTIGPSCNGETDGSIQIVATGRGGQFDFTWGAPVSGPVSDDTSSLVTGLMAGSYDVTVTETADATCTVPLTLQLSEPEILSLTVDTSQDIRCFGEKNGLISLLWMGGNQDMAPAIRWSGDTISNTLLATDLDAGIYDIVLTDHRGCADSVSVTINEPGELFARIPAPTPPICNGSQTTVTVDTAFGGTGSDFTFTVNNQAPRQPLSSEIPIFAGEHLISIFDEQGCSIDTFIMVSEPDPLQVDLGEDQEVGLGDSVRLNPVIVALAPVDTYIWTPVDDLSCVNCANPIVRPFETRTYNLTVVDQDGCEGMDDIMISVNRARRVYIPNGFTPNGDGLNEKWQVHTSFGVNQVISTHLFDRWGNLVFEDGSDRAGPGGSRGWNGRFDGKLMNPGVYVYMVKVEFIDGIVFTYRGDVTMTY